MERRTPLELNEHIGTAGWAGILAVAGVFDYFATETLSHAFKRAVHEHPVATIGAYSLLTAHLFGLIPEKYDPLSVGLRIVKEL